MVGRRSLLLGTQLGALAAGCTLAAAWSLSSSNSELSAAAEAALPTVVNAPGTWSSEERLTGPVAAIGVATRTEARGIRGKSESLELFGVSALDGSAAWLELEGHEGFDQGVALSPDGRWIGWVLDEHPSRQPGGLVDGYAVLDTSTGEVRELADPRADRLRNVGVADLAFSGDSRYLLTSYALPGQPGGSRSDEFVAWEVETGVRTVLEGPGEYWVPSLGSAPTGVVWSRGRDVFWTDPAVGTRTTTRLPQDVIAASWGPDRASFAYVGGSPDVDDRWRLHAGASPEEAVDRVVDLPTHEVSQILGWQDATHVVVGNYRTWVHIVDVESGDVKRVDLAGYGRTFNAPVLANALWQRPLRTPTDPTGTSDPRRPWHLGGLALLLAGATAWTVRRRARRKGSTTPPLA